jgi:hypothetical protein
MNLQLKNLNGIESDIIYIIWKIYKILLFPNNDKNDKKDNKNDIENYEIFKKLATYLREGLNSNNNIQIFVLDQKYLDSINHTHIHVHIQLFRIYLYSTKIDIIYKNLDFFFKFYKIIYEKNYNYRIFNDYAFVFRLLTDEKLLLKLNNKEKPNEKCFIEYKILMMNFIEQIIKDKINMNKKYTNYDIKDLFIGNNRNPDYEIYDRIYKRVFDYLIFNRFYIDRNIQNNGNYHNQINQYIMYSQQQQSTTNTTIDNNNPQNNDNQPPPQQQQQSFINDKWLETFHINDFKYFILIRSFIEEFYCSMRKSLVDIDELGNIDKNSLII